MGERMRLFLTILAACLMLETAHAANFPYIRLNAKTNRLSDSGTAATFNGTALVLSTEAGITNALGRAISGTGPLAGTSVTDAKQPIASTLTALSTNSIIGTGRIALESAAGIGDVVSTNLNTFTGTNNFRSNLNKDANTIKLFAKPTILAFEGDSITSGAYLTNLMSYPAQLVTNQYAFQNLQLYTNFAVSSSQFDTMTNRFSGVVGAKPAAGQNGFLVIMEGVNDILFSGNGIATNQPLWVTNYMGYVTNAQANGYVVACLTIAKAKSIIDNGTQETVRSNVNALIKASSIPDFVIDTDLLIPSTNTTYYLYDGVNGPAGSGSGLHLTTNSHTIIAQALLSVIEKGTNGLKGSYNNGLVYSKSGFVGDGSRISSLNGSQITSGTVPASNMAVNTIVSGGSNTTVASNTVSGVTTYTVSATAAASPSSFLTKKVTIISTGGSTTLTTIGDAFTSSGTGTGSASRVQGDGTNFGYLSFRTGTTTNSSYIVSQTDSDFVPLKTTVLALQFKLSNTNNLRAGFGAAQFPANIVSELPTTARRKWQVCLDTSLSPNWKVYTSDNSSVETQDTGVAADASWHTFTVNYTSSSLVLSIDGTAKSTNTLYFTSGTALTAVMGVLNFETADKNFDFGQFYMEQDY